MEAKDKTQYPFTEDKEIGDNNNNNGKQLKEEEEHEEEEEEIPPEFLCCICLELLYKPVVLACGHLSCFWCVHFAMNTWHESNCPVCRRPYNHFPNVCQLVHFLLLKMYPIAYRRRERQVGEEEEEIGNFSPQFEDHVIGSHSNEELDIPSKSLHPPTHQPEQHYSENCFPRSHEGTESAASEDCGVSRKGIEEGTQKQISISVSDLQCAECKKLLFRPIVLNCGHVYCESCIFTPAEETPRCQICQSLHPNGFPDVCLVLEHFLEEHFPEIYAKRREVLAPIKRNSISSSTQIQSAKRSSMFPNSVCASSLFSNGPAVHFGVGCDSCGMSPIIGERYKCTDCMEKIGFDLCEACYNKPSKIMGRFNQQHKPEHKFVNVPSDLMFRPSVDDEDSFDGSEDEDNVLGLPHGVGNGANDAEVVSSPLLNGELEEDHSNDMEVDSANDMEVVSTASNQDDDSMPRVEQV